METGSIVLMIVMLVVLIAGFYFLIIRPQKSRANQHTEFVEQLKIGDEVYTIGGMYGKLVAMDEKSFVLETENGAEMRFMKAAIAGYISAIDGSGEENLVEAAEDVEAEDVEAEINEEETSEK